MTVIAAPIGIAIAAFGFLRLVADGDPVELHV